MSFIKGHDYTWDLFLRLDPQNTCARALVFFDAETDCYSLRSYGQDITISLNDRKVTASTAIGNFLINRTNHFFDLALLWYLISAKDSTASGELVRPAAIKGGQIFVTGSHVLPLNTLAKLFGNNTQGFIERGRLLGGEVVDLGDAAIRIYPFLRLPVTLILWQADDEFPARVDFFFDSTCDHQLPTDVLWSMAMVCCIGMATDQLTVDS